MSLVLWNDKFVVIEGQLWSRSPQGQYHCAFVRIGSGRTPRGVLRPLANSCPYVHVYVDSIDVHVNRSENVRGRKVRSLPTNGTRESGVSSSSPATPGGSSRQ